MGIENVLHVAHQWEERLTHRRYWWYPDKVPIQSDSVPISWSSDCQKLHPFAGSLPWPEMVRNELPLESFLNDAWYVWVNQIWHGLTRSHKFYIIFESPSMTKFQVPTEETGLWQAPLAALSAWLPSLLTYCIFLISSTHLHPST